MELIETYFLTGVVTYQCSVTQGGSTEHFTTKDGFRSKYPCKKAKYSVSYNAVL